MAAQAQGASGAVDALLISRPGDWLTQRDSSGQRLLGALHQGCADAGLTPPAAAQDDVARLHALCGIAVCLLFERYPPEEDENAHVPQILQAVHAAPRCLQLTITHCWRVAGEPSACGVAEITIGL